MVTKQCESCKIAFAYEPNPNFPDRRKYCDVCSLAKKAQWEAKQNGTPIASPMPSANTTTQTSVPASSSTVEEETGKFQSTVWTHNVKANSYEVGSAGKRHKIYYDTVEELASHMDSLKEAGLLEEDIDFKAI